MNKLYIGDTEYLMPEKLSVDKWVEICKYDISLNFMWGKIISIVMDIPMEEIELIPDKTKELLIVFIYPLLNLSDTKKNDKYNGGQYINLNNLTLGDFIDMDIWINEGVHKNINNIIKKLYGVDIKRGTTIDEVIGGIYYYINYRTNIYQQYKNLFKIDDDNLETDVDIEYVKKNIRKSWLEVIMVLANNDVLKMDLVSELPLTQAFNWLAWNKEKIEKEKDELQKHNRNNRNNLR